MEDNRHKYKQLRFTEAEYERLVKLATKLGVIASQPDRRLDRTKLSVESMIVAWSKREMED